MACPKQINFILKGKPTCAPYWKDLVLGNCVINTPHMDLDQVRAEVNVNLHLACFVWSWA